MRKQIALSESAVADSRTQALHCTTLHYYLAQLRMSDVLCVELGTA